MSANDSSNSSSQIEIEIRFFAGAAELVGKREVRVTVAAGAGLSDVVQRLLEHFPQLERLAGLSRWAVGTEFISDDFRFASINTIAMIPPVSGG